MSERFIPIAELQNKKTKELVAGNALTDSGRRIVEILHGFNHSMRLTIMDYLRRMEVQNVTQIHTYLGVDQEAASHHLIKMNKQGLLARKNVARTNEYSISRCGMQYFADAAGCLNEISRRETKDTKEKKSLESLVEGNVLTATGEEVRRIADIFAEKTRLVIMHKIGRTGVMSATEIHEYLEMAQNTTSTHLGKMREEIVLTQTRDGKKMMYSLEDRNKVKVNLLADYLEEFSTPYNVRPLPRSSSKSRT